ncbi:GNAT family N-acetyltransferase [Vibrio mangrovi]|uniref:N-acetyltransferase n=1 Tax=Vibrio mangrovi TaxID=474394 RepID=A0A1Y6IZ55_9VIBR|nr:N-acetyltransferase [Vibrio mangrovi]MDW6003081.1 N-acetyltransferase [Vibrio mangrovi]SMS01323.1 hypothetical protein VIM7927_02609 [Vibrio mangrovi]
MLIRTEAPADILPIDHLLRSSLGVIEDADMVMAFRESGRITLSLVACSDDGELLGYILFTPVANDGVFQSWQHLHLLIAEKNCAESNVIEKQLITEGLDSLYELGYPVCTAFGTHEHYLAHGFRLGRDFGLSTVHSMQQDEFLVCEMLQGAVAEVSDHLVVFDSSMI